MTQRSADELAFEELKALEKEYQFDCLQEGYSFFDDAKHAMLQMHSYGVA